MDAVSNQDEQTLRVELDAARARLEGLARELRSLDEALEELAPERQQYALLQEACSSLEKLSELGGAELFWGDRNGQHHLGSVRRRADEFERRIGDIEHSRLSLLARVEQEQETSEYLEIDLDDVQRREAMRKLEWIVEREIGPLPDCEPVMPWSRKGEDDRRFRKSLAIALALALALVFLVPLIDLPLPEPWQVAEVPERLTRLLKEEPLPPPAPVQPPLAADKKLADAPEQPLLPTEKPTAEARSEHPPAEGAGAKGLLAFREQFSSLADAKPAARLGAQARIDRSGEAAIGNRGRSLVTTQGPGSSGGIDLASLSRGDVGGGGQALEGVQVGKATSSIGGVAGEGRPLSGGPALGRTDEEIQIVFDRHKAALYRLYNRELRRDPTLRGQIVLRLTIESDGSVSLCQVQASDMDAPQLSEQIAARVKSFAFEAKPDVPAMTILYPIDFLPAT